MSARPNDLLRPVFDGYKPPDGDMVLTLVNIERVNPIITPIKDGVIHNLIDESDDSVP